MESTQINNKKCKTDTILMIDEADFEAVEFLPNDITYAATTASASFLLVDGNENLRTSTLDNFCKKLQCLTTDKVKVLSIFGNTGDGKSHTLNNAFFNGKEVFETSAGQKSGTLGVFAAIQQELNLLCLDTEGLLGSAMKNNQRLRLLLKILAISDVVIYRTRSERLHSDMYDFLGTASKAYNLHFSEALQSLGHESSLGPAIIIFHETHRTEPLHDSIDETVEDNLRENFTFLDYDTSSYSSIRYVGVQTLDGNSTSYTELVSTVSTELANNSVRRPRQLDVIFRALNLLRQKFAGEIVENVNPFPEQFFSCPARCQSCKSHCQRSMGHENDGECHFSTQSCSYQHQFENKINICAACYKNGKRVRVTISSQSQAESAWYAMAKYAWNGTVISCSNCGEIYKSRRYWYGNSMPEDSAICSQIVHVWDGTNLPSNNETHSAQIVVDNVAYISESIITNISATPVKAVSGWIADQFAPAYWMPNNEIIVCENCKLDFAKSDLKKHHCRACGKGFCNACTQHRISVPARGWQQPVRVCDVCNEASSKLNNGNTAKRNVPVDETNIRARKYGETVYNTISKAACLAFDYPKEIIKDNVRPSYWVPDSESPACFLCKTEFGRAEELVNAQDYRVQSSDSSSGDSSSKKVLPIKDCRRHHCRRCGQSVCAACSTSRLSVPERGWTGEVRVCDACIQLPSNMEKIAAELKDAIASCDVDGIIVANDNHSSH